MSAEADLPTHDASGMGAGTVLATLDDYDAAAALVDRLAQARFPLERLSIVGHGVEVIEQVTGRFGGSRALATSALNGGLIGLFFGLVFSWSGALTPEVHRAWLGFDGFVYGALLGVGLALLLQALGLRRHEFASTRILTAARFDVVLTGGDVPEARRILGRDGR